MIRSLLEKVAQFFRWKKLFFDYMPLKRGSLSSSSSAINSEGTVMTPRLQFESRTKYCWRDKYWKQIQDTLAPSISAKGYRISLQNLNSCRDLGSMTLSLGQFQPVTLVNAPSSPKIYASIVHDSVESSPHDGKREGASPKAAEEDQGDKQGHSRSRH